MTRPKDDSNGHTSVHWYADESGHSGPRYTNDQRYFVFGGPLVPQSREAQLQELVQAAVATQQSEELKGSRLLKSDRGRATLERLLRLTLDLGIPLVAVVRDKRVDILTLVPQLLCDPDWNDHPRAAEVHFNGVPFLPAIADLPDDALADFVDGYADRDAAKLAAAVSRMARVLRITIGPQRLAAQGLPYLPDVLERVDPATLLQEGRGFAPYEPALIQCLRMAKALTGAPPRIMLDEQAEYRKNIEAWRLGLGSLGLFESINMGASHQTPGIQVADLFVAGVRHAVTDPDSLQGLPVLKSVLREVVEAQTIAVVLDDETTQRLGVALR